MKSPATSLIKIKKNAGTMLSGGFLTIEALVACTFMALMIPAALSLSWSTDSFILHINRDLDALATSSAFVSDGMQQQISVRTDFYKNEFGKQTCTIGQSVSGSGSSTFTATSPETPYFGVFSTITGASLVAKNDIVYEAIDSTVQSQPDLFIIDARVPTTPVVLSALNTGPGLAMLTVAGHYIYAANKSSTAQLQIIDIADRVHPALVAKLKLPLPYATSTAPNARSIFYKDGLVYLGTEKWDGPEFNVIDVHDPLHPYYIAGFETGTLVNDIFVKDTRAYLAVADVQQLRVLDTHDFSRIIQLNYFSPPGSDILEGKTLSVDASTPSTTTLYFGRSGGGFNNAHQFEFFSFNISNDPVIQYPIIQRDIPGGVYATVSSGDAIFLATHSSTAPLQLWKKDFTAPPVYSVIPAPSMMVCDHAKLYSASVSSSGFSISAVHQSTK